MESGDSTLINKMAKRTKAIPPKSIGIRYEFLDSLRLNKGYAARVAVEKTPIKVIRAVNSGERTGIIPVVEPINSPAIIENKIVKIRGCLLVVMFLSL